MRKIILALVTLGFVAASPAFAQDTKSGMPDEATMKKMMELSAPGPAHKVLEPLVGSWDYTVTMKMGPDEPEQTSSGTMEAKWVMDGRFVQQLISGTMDMGMGPQKFEGIGFVGHDNVKGEYRSLWMDNMNTGMMISNGKYDEATKTITESGSFYCPVRGKEVELNAELHFVDATHMTYSMYDKTDAGEKYKAMEIKYTKK